MDEKEQVAMDAIDERFAVYMVVVFLCSEIGMWAGAAVGGVTFAIITSGIELAYWFGRVMEDGGQFGAAKFEGE